MQFRVIHPASHSFGWEILVCCWNIDKAYAALTPGGVAFDSAPQLIYRDGGTFGPAGGEEWMAFFKDPDGNVLALAARKATPAA